MTIGLPRGAVQVLPNFVRWLEANGKNSDGGGAGLVKEWGLSDSTLEEVFLRLAVATTEVNAVDGRLDGEADDGGDGGGDAYEVSADGADVRRVRSKPMCQLCNVRCAEKCVLYTEDRLAVTAEDLVCEKCALGIHGAGDDHADEAAAAAATTQDAVCADMGDDVSRSVSGPGEAEAADEGDGDPDAVLDASDLNTLSPFVNHVRACMWKEMSLLRRQKKQNICQLVTLLAVVLCTIFLSPDTGGWREFVQCPNAPYKVPKGCKFVRVLM
jgi:hypothetical protein